MDEDALARVTEGQRACLRLVLHHMSSKEIARALGISRHTVDQRLKLAMRELGATSRVEAAKRFAALAGAAEHQSLACQSPDIEASGVSPSLAAFPRERPVRGRAPLQEARHHESLHRIGWIAAIAAGAAIAFAALFMGLNALSEFTR